ncbi:hypothetical protein ACFLWS_01980 [Chloroflexota bacterium]
MALRKQLNRIKGFLVNSVIAGSRSQKQSAGFLLLLVLMLLVAWYKWSLFGGNAAPPGSDGGQWLAFGHKLFTGESVRAGFQFYPPILPFAVQLVSLVKGPLIALKLVGIFASVSIAVPVYLLLHKTLTPWLSAAVAITATLTPFNNEILSFGGYPQLLGTSFLLFSTFFLLMGFNTGRRRWFLAAGVAAAATIGSNVLPALVLVMTSGVITLLFLYKLWLESRSILFRRFRTAFLWWFLPSVILSLPFSNVYFAYLSTAVSSTTSPTQLTVMQIAGWANSAWLFEVVLWAGIASVAGFFLLLLGRGFFDNQVLPAVASVALLLATCFGFLLMREIRFLGFFEISLILMMGFVPGMLDSILTYLKARQFLGRLILIFALSFVLIVGTIGHRRLLIAYDWYQVVNTPVLTAFDWLRDNADSGSIVAATGTDGGHNYGWWIEGYAHLPTYMAGDPSLFLDAEERTQVELARRILILDTSPSKVRVLVEQYNIRFLFLDKKCFQKPLIDLHRAGFVERFENDAILIMENKKP